MGNNSVIRRDEIEEIEENFATRLRSAVVSANLNVAKLAVRAEIESALIRHYLMGGLPGIKNAAKLARALNVSVGWLVAGENPRWPEHPEPETGRSRLMQLAHELRVRNEQLEDAIAALHGHSVRRSLKWMVVGALASSTGLLVAALLHHINF